MTRGAASARPLVALLLALPLPIAVLAASLDFLRVRGPFWLGTNSDPSYVYVLSTVRLVEGSSPRHLDHPGLAVHRIGATVATLAHRVARRTRPLAGDLLADPEWYAGAIVRTVLILNALALVLAGLGALRLTGQLPLMWLVQAAPLFSPSALFELTDLKPEPVLYLAASLVAAVLCSLAREDGRRRTLAVCLLGLLLGVAGAAKFTAVSLVAIPLLALTGARERALCLATAAAAFAACAAPAWPEWRRAVGFVTQVATGSGLYGQRMFAEELPLLKLWTRILVEEAAFFAVLGAGIAAAVVARRRHAAMAPAPARALALRALWSLVAVAGLQLVLLAKHPYQPRYLLPSLALAGLMMALSAWLTCWREDGARDRRACAVLVLLAALIAGLETPRFVRRRAQALEATRAQLAARRTAESLREECVLVTYYRASSPLLAWFQAEALGGPTRASLRAPVRTDEYFLVPGGRLHTLAGPVDAASLAHRTCFVLQGSPGGPGRPFAAFRRDAIPMAGEVAIRFSSPWESVFEVRSPDAVQAPSSTGSPLRMGSRP